MGGNITDTSEHLDTTRRRDTRKELSRSWRQLGLAEPPDYIGRLLEEGCSEPADVSATVRPRPPWFNRELYQLGQQCFRDNCLTLMMLHLVGLLQILRVPTILDVLIASGKSYNRETAFLRYLETARMVIGWYRGDIFQQGQRACQRIKVVDARHQHYFGKAAAAGVSAPSQYDMVLTQWAFCGYALLNDRAETGLYLKPGYLEGLAHFWRCVGYRLGIPDRLNVCGADAAEGRRRCAALLHWVMRPLMVLPALRHRRFVPMSNAMLEGVSLIVPVCDNLAFRALSWRLAFPGGGHHVHSRPWSRWTYAAMLGFYENSWKDNAIGRWLRWIGNLLLYIAVRACAHARFIPWTSNVRRKVITFIWLGMKDVWCAGRELLGLSSCGRWGKQWFHRRSIDDTVAVWDEEVAEAVRSSVIFGMYSMDSIQLAKLGQSTK